MSLSPDCFSCMKMFHFSGGKPGLWFCFFVWHFPQMRINPLSSHTLSHPPGISLVKQLHHVLHVIHHRKAAMLCDNLQKAVFCVLNAICGLGADKNPKVSVPRAGGTFQLSLWPRKITPY